MDLRKYYFSQRTMDYGNALPQSAVDSMTINSFEQQLSQYI